MSATVSQQETFDRVAAHLLAQGERCVYTYGDGEDDFVCRYRHCGKSCAAGCLIPDDLYSTSMEGLGVRGNSQAGHVLSDLGHDIDLVEDLVVIHDEMEPSQWKSELARLAKRCGLTFEHA